MERLLNHAVVQPRSINGHRRRHCAQKVVECGVAAEAQQALLRLLRRVELGGVLELHDALQRLERHPDALAELLGAPLVVAHEGAKHLDAVQYAALVALLRRGGRGRLVVARQRARCTLEHVARPQRHQRRRSARRPYALLLGVGGDVARGERHRGPRVHARHRRRRLVQRVRVVEVRVDEGVGVRRLLLQQRPVVANGPKEWAKGVALSAALLR